MRTTKKTHSTKCLGVEETESEWKFKKESPCMWHVSVAMCYTLLDVQQQLQHEVLTVVSSSYILDLDRSRCVCSGLVGREDCLKLLAADF